ncbi:iron-containing alcohol dehydrogenase family protein [Tautonia plasticadhaerens]|uniref:Glycerol-1-phosphate dehydrogenase [NAD(P)+] n=1 Tax=Tautonia plasticadhaerens TaxID=2527974 RepID=A0A518HCT2_9BACT|nr:iron-containing alcohol dehydrogenase family protein [Tautonia plasticadhaerens]QDV38669.1 Glycerol-1-phosphate dehydrogenase [NAD(P)+] [Tautonia plasticadhaerens]
MTGWRAEVGIPSFVRIKPGAIDRLGIYAARHSHRRVALVVSEGLPGGIVDRAEAGLGGEGAERVDRIEAGEASFEAASAIFSALPTDCQAVIGLGGGKALDLAKYAAFLAGRPMYAVPTSLSNDGFCSPQSSLTLGGARRSLPAHLPFAVVVDTAVCLGAPRLLWWSGVGDLSAKVTAVRDWKLSYHATGEPVDDFAALLSDATVSQFFGGPSHDEEGMRLLATALLLNGIAMAVCGSSRPASGAEHLISHALDAIARRPRLHGLQVGVATYLVSRLQGGGGTARIAEAFDRTGFWEGVRADPFPKAEWLEAVRRAPAINPGRYTVLSTRDCVPEVAAMIEGDGLLRGCFEG